MSRWCLAFLLLVSSGEVAWAGEGTVYTVAGDEVHLRSGPATRYPVLGKLARDSRIVVVGNEGRWKKARVPGGFACFVHGSLVERGDDGTAKVTAERVLLRATASKDHEPLDTRLERGEELTVLGEEGEWVRVISPARATAWVFEDLVKELGPPKEYRAALERDAAKRRVALLGDSPEREAKIRAAKERAARRKAVLALGKEILAGKGDVAEQQERLTRIALSSDDDLTRGYANALLSLVALRKDARELEDRLAKLSKERAEEVAKVREMLARARKLYEDARKRAEAMKTRREEPYRAVGTIEKREGGYVLVAKGRVLFHLESKAFRLADYVGKRVGVNGRLMVTDVDEGRSHLLVSKMEILPGKAAGRPDR
ncbi:MAG: SH3 domain-containing protein [Planctomycetota bacterium]